MFGPYRARYINQTWTHVTSFFMLIINAHNHNWTKLLVGFTNVVGKPLLSFPMNKTPTFYINIGRRLNTAQGIGRLTAVCTGLQ